MPRAAELDSTLALWREGYDFIWSRCRQLKTDAFRTRVMGMPAVCVHGREGVRLFYDESLVARAGALPRRVVTSLFGKHAVHTLDDEAHRARKAAFLSLMSNLQLARLMELTAGAWRDAILRWERMPRVVLFEEVPELLMRAVCEWAGVPLAPREVHKRTLDMVRMVDAFGGVGPRLWLGKLARARAELWLGELIKRVRAGAYEPPATSALAVMAALRDTKGEPLDLRTAAVELINVLRPTVAISWYITFAALALHDQPHLHEWLLDPSADGSRRLDQFMQEIRRFYPFTPFLGARARQDFDWHGHHFKRGTMILLDVHGTNHDPVWWPQPEQFRPERFGHWRDDELTLIPQGGGDRRSGHRCPGEWLTMHSLALAVHTLSRCMTYDVLPQDLSFDRSRMPTRPRSGFVLHNVRHTPHLMEAQPRLPSRTAAQEADFL